jgi:hypothetical protein
MKRGVMSSIIFSNGLVEVVTFLRDRPILLEFDGNLAYMGGHSEKAKKFQKTVRRILAVIP